MEFRRTDGKDKDFIENCRLLDMDLDRRVGKKIQRDKYRVAGGGAVRRYEAENMELKRERKAYTGV